MPETSYTNGYVNGHVHYDMEDGSNFLFTSESVGEGHPGECIFSILGHFNMAPVEITLWFVLIVRFLAFPGMEPFSVSHRCYELAQFMFAHF